VAGSETEKRFSEGAESVTKYKTLGFRALWIQPPRGYYEQEKYTEADQLFRQSVRQREKVLGAEHVDALESKYWLTGRHALPAAEVRRGGAAIPAVGLATRQDARRRTYRPA
jgi:hypothetical protein